MKDTRGQLHNYFNKTERKASKRQGSDFKYSIKNPWFNSFICKHFPKKKNIKEMPILEYYINLNTSFILTRCWKMTITFKFK